MYLPATYESIRTGAIFLVSQMIAIIEAASVSGEEEWLASHLEKSGML